MNRQLQLFQEHLPEYGFGTDDIRCGLYRHPLAQLITKAIVQYNYRNSVKWLTYDDDDPMARFNWNDRNCPPPNILALNQTNGHGHLFYGLEIPVHKNETSSQKALRYLASIDIALTGALDADRGFAKLVAKNPLHDKWDVLFPRESLYDLDELASWLDLEKYQDKRKRLPSFGYGRNVNLFNAVREWAYRQRRKQSFLSEEMFRDTVRNHALAVNGQINEPPLTHSEVRSTAKSISQWTWRHLSPEGFAQWQRKNTELASRKRHRTSMELRWTILETVEQCPTLTQADVAALCGVHRVTVAKHLKEARKGNLSDIGATTFNRGRPISGTEDV